MIQLLAWTTWQRAFFQGTLARRKDPRAPCVMRYVSVAADLDDDPRAGATVGNWRQFVDLVGGREAETFFLRILQHVATNRGSIDGTIRVGRAAFGALVLSRPWDLVDTQRGEAVYDALVASGIAAESTPDERARGPAGGRMDRKQRRPRGVRAARVPDPLTPAQVAAARVVAAAVEAGSIPLEEPAERRERDRLAKAINEGPVEERAAAQERRRALVRAIDARRVQVLETLRAVAPDPDAIRALLARFESLECVRVPCLAARKAARADDRDQRRAARAAADGDPSTATATSSNGHVAIAGRSS